jgi:hypothetical protein
MALVRWKGGGAQKGRSSPILCDHTQLDDGRSRAVKGADRVLTAVTNALVKCSKRRSLSRWSTSFVREYFQSIRFAFIQNELSLPSGINHKAKLTVLFLLSRY